MPAVLGKGRGYGVLNAHSISGGKPLNGGVTIGLHLASIADVGDTAQMSWLMNALSGAKGRMVTPADALPGRAEYPFEVPVDHAVLGTALRADGAQPWPPGISVIYLGMGCFWGAEEIYWRLPGVFTTAVGYQGGFTPHPTYEEVCSGRTGHTEAVLVAYRAEQISTLEILRTFWEQHDPTQGFQQGNDMGTQYRSAIYFTTDEQREVVERTGAAYAPVLAERGYGAITTEIGPAADRPFYYAEGYHQQYLYKVPNGYRCHSQTGVPLPLA
jgi:peptide-methionine (S)-S-oxide reductase